MRRGLQFKLVMILVLLIVSVMSVVGTVLIINVTAYYNNAFIRQMNVTFEDDDMLADLAEIGFSEGEKGINSLLEIFATQLGIGSFRNYYVLDMRGNYLSGSNDELGIGLEITPNIVRAMNGQKGDETSISANYMDIAVPLESGHIIYIKDTKEDTDNINWMLITIIIETVFLGIIMAVVLSFFLARTITTPVDRITKGAAKLASGSFDERIKVESYDEIGTLTDTFNNMAGALKSTIDDLESEKNKLETIFRYLTDGVVAFGRDGILLSINMRAADLLGEYYAENKDRFDKVFAAVPEADFGEIVAGAQESVDAAVRGRVLQISFAPFGGGSGAGLSGGIIAVLHDVTEQQRLEDLRREFIANVSHELRTPLTNVKSYTETIYETDDLAPESRNHFLEVVLGETDRMIRIVRDLTDLSRIDDDKFHLTRENIDLRRLIERVAVTVKLQAEEHGHTMEYDMPSDPLDIYGDTGRIEQVLINILSNSIKYTPDGGRITVSARLDGNFAELKVRDNGIGIPEQDLERIFERFYRVDKARSREKGGTGLGLAIAKGIVDAHGGTISIASVSGSHTEVTLRLPYAHPPE